MLSHLDDDAVALSLAIKPEGRSVITVSRGENCIGINGCKCKLLHVCVECKSWVEKESVKVS